ncbi:atherin-like [Papio anubis]|uniref:atherin-like n=1 Tax=Papio anubis TaxID=9555 RepID=UPI0012ADE05A|nr:atherin-like [Papio anubis]
MESPGSRLIRLREPPAALSDAPGPPSIPAGGPKPRAELRGGALVTPTLEAVAGLETPPCGVLRSHSSPRRASLRSLSRSARIRRCPEPARSAQGREARFPRERLRTVGPVPRGGGGRHPATPQRRFRRWRRGQPTRPLEAPPRLGGARAGSSSSPPQRPAPARKPKHSSRPPTARDSRFAAAQPCAPRLAPPARPLRAPGPAERCCCWLPPFSWPSCCCSTWCLRSSAPSPSPCPGRMWWLQEVPVASGSALPLSAINKEPL